MRGPAAAGLRPARSFARRRPRFVRSGGARSRCVPCFTCLSCCGRTSVRPKWAPMKIAAVREFALGLPEATEEPHFDFASFRVRGKIFVTVPPDETHIHVFVA